MLRAGLWHRGAIRIVNIDTPAPGTDWFVTVPTVPEGIWWRLKSCFFSLLTSVAVANRSARVNVCPGGDASILPYMQVGSPALVPAATIARWAFSEGVPEVATADPAIQINREASFPVDFRVQPGHIVRSSVFGLQAADQISGVQLVIEEWVYEPAGERTSNIGDEHDATRVDTIKLTKAMEKIAQLLEAQQATP